MAFWDNWSMDNFVNHSNPGNSPLWQNMNASRWDPRNSSMMNGGGTPWSAGNHNSASDYGNVAKSGLMGAASLAWTGNPYAIGAGAVAGLAAGATGLDYSGQDRADADSAAAQKEREDQANSDLANKNAANAKAAIDAKNSAWTASGNTNAATSNSLESALMQKYRQSKGAGNYLYGGM